MKNRDKTQINRTSNKELKWYTFEQVFKKASTTKTFEKGYSEEINRIRLAKRIREIRKLKKLTQTDVALKAHMPQSVIARIESGEHSISLDTLNRIAHALGKEVALV